jgi:hypothetical protein
MEQSISLSWIHVVAKQTLGIPTSALLRIIQKLPFNATIDFIFSTKIG